MKLSQVWDLESIFQGGSSSPSFSKACNEIETKIFALKTLLSTQKLSDALHLSQEIGLLLREMDTFVSCLISQDVNDSKAIILEPKLRTFFSAFENVMLLFDEHLKKPLRKAI